MSAPQMPEVNFSCTHIARLLADKITPDFNFKEQLWFVARANAQGATRYLCLLLRTQFHFQPHGEGESFFHDCFTDCGGADHEPFNAIISEQCAKEIAQRALILRDARQRLQNDPNAFKFLQLPYDIRLHVYEFALINNEGFEPNCGAPSIASGGRTWTCDLRLQASKGKFGKDINTALPLTNHQIFDEAEPIFHQIRSLNIGPHLDKGLEVLRRLSPRARRDIRVVYIALPMGHFHGRRRIGFEDNEKAWSQLCYYMSQNLRLRTLSFNLSAEPPPTNFIDDVAWVKYLVMIRGLKHLQPKISFFGLYDPVNFSRDESDSELDPGSQKGLDARRQALISYLKSEMC